MKDETKLEKLYIYSLDVNDSLGKKKSGVDDGEGPLDIVAQYNPKEISIDRSVPWQKHAGNKGGDVDIEFTGGEARSLSLELFFDEYETEGNVDELYVSKLEAMANPTPKDRKDEKGRPDHDRPHLLEVNWGKVFKKPFRCVIESLSVKYTMFSADGVPVRATVNLKLKEAKNPGKGSATTPTTTSSGQNGT